MGIDLKPVAKSTLMGTLAGGLTGFLFGGPGGALAGANFGGSLGAQVVLYNKGEDLANRTIEHAGRRFEEVTDRTFRRVGKTADRVGRATEKSINRVADKLLIGIENVANVYSKAVITGTVGSYTLEYSRYAGQTAKDICISDTEFMQCYALRLAMISFLGATVLSTYLLVKDLKKLRNEGLFHASSTNFLPSLRNAYRTTTNESQKETCTHRRTPEAALHRSEA